MFNPCVKSPKGSETAEELGLVVSDVLGKESALPEHFHALPPLTIFHFSRRQPLCLRVAARGRAHTRRAASPRVILHVQECAVSVRRYGMFAGRFQGVELDHLQRVLVHGRKQTLDVAVATFHGLAAEL